VLQRRQWMAHQTCNLQVLGSIPAAFCMLIIIVVVVGVISGGCEAAVHATRRFLTIIPDNFVTVKIDFFNWISERIQSNQQCRHLYQRFMFLLSSLSAYLHSSIWPTNNHIGGRRSTGRSIGPSPLLLYSPTTSPLSLASDLTLSTWMILLLAVPWPMQQLTSPLSGVQVHRLVYL